MSEDGPVTDPAEPVDPAEPAEPGQPVDPPLPPRRLSVFLAVAATAVALDLISKVLIVASVDEGEPHKLIGSAVYLLLTRNSGAAFSLGSGGGATIVLTVIAAVVVLVIARAARRLRSITWAIALGLILGGALGNLIDRLFRAPGIGRGHVVDWISVFADDGSVWPIFNLADSAIVCGGVLAAVAALRGIDFDGRRAGMTPSAGDRRSRDRPSGDRPTGG
jgi:signal peptidase II